MISFPIFIPDHLDNSQSYPSPGASSQAVISATHALQHCFVQTQLEAGAIKHLSLVWVPGDQTVHLHGLVLTNPMAASLGLWRAEKQKKNGVKCTTRTNRSFWVLISLVWPKCHLIFNDWFVVKCVRVLDWTPKVVFLAGVYTSRCQTRDNYQSAKIL